jgi:hypothetical protein
LEWHKLQAHRPHDRELLTPVDAKKLWVIAPLQSGKVVALRA